MRNLKSVCFNLLLIVAMAFVAGCGSDSSSGDSAGTTTVTGNIFASHVAGAQVTVKDVSGVTVAGPVTTGSDGSYSVDIPSTALSADLVFEASGGTFTDEATDLPNRNAGAMGAYVAGGTLSSGSSVNVTPGTAIISYLVRSHGMTLSAAQGAFNNAFGYSPDISIAPVFANVSSGAAAAEKLEGLRAATFSQMGFDLGLTAEDQFALFAALARDLSDGSLDGQDASGVVTIAGTAASLPADAANCFNRAMINFRSSGNDKSSLTSAQIGTLPFAKVALTASYRVEYVPGMMGAMEGKTTFKLNITNLSDDSPATGLTPTLMPMMNMASHKHSTPVEGCTESSTLGTYDCTVYYAMASTMSGMSMGYWELKVMAAMGETAYFYPPVMMKMGGETNKATLKGQTDKIAGMNGGMAMSRPYQIYNDGATAEMMGGTHKLELFIAAQESMMSFPAVSGGTVLNSGSADYELTVSTMTVEVSTNGTDWVSAADAGGSHWTATGLTGLTTDEAGTVYVKLTINGEQKTTDGNTPAGDGTNDYATITVKPGAMSM